MTSWRWPTRRSTGTHHGMGSPPLPPLVPNPTPQTEAFTPYQSLARITGETKRRNQTPAFFTCQLRANVIANACESTPYNLSRDAALRARFRVKGQPGFRPLSVRRRGRHGRGEHVRDHGVAGLARRQRGPARHVPLRRLVALPTVSGGRQNRPVP